MLTHHTTHQVHGHAAAGQSAEAAMQKHLAGLHELLEQQLHEIRLVAETFDYSKFAGVTGLLSGSFANAAH